MVFISIMETKLREHDIAESKVFITGFKRSVGKSYREHCKVCDRMTMHVLGEDCLICGQCQIRSK